MRITGYRSGHGGQVFATIGALDMALWDLKAKIAQEPLWRTLSAADRFVPGYASGLDYALTDDELVALHERWARGGFTGTEVKPGPGALRRCPVLWPRSWTSGASQPPQGSAEEGRPTLSRKVCSSRSGSTKRRYAQVRPMLARKGLSRRRAAESGTWAARAVRRGGQDLAPGGDGSAVRCGAGMVRDSAPLESSYSIRRRR